jgi:hypothetical protein
MVMQAPARGTPFAQSLFGTEPKPGVHHAKSPSHRDIRRIALFGGSRLRAGHPHRPVAPDPNTNSDSRSLADQSRHRTGNAAGDAAGRSSKSADDADWSPKAAHQSGTAVSSNSRAIST